MQASAALCFVMVAMLSRAQGDDRTSRFVWAAAIVFAAMGAFYAVFVAICCGPVVDFLCNGWYLQYADLARWIGVLTVPPGRHRGAGSGSLRSAKRTDEVFVAYAVHR